MKSSLSYISYKGIDSGMNFVYLKVTAANQILTSRRITGKSFASVKSVILRIIDGGRMKKLILTMLLLLCAGMLFGQQKQQIQQLQDEIVRLNIVLGDVKADRDALTIAIVELKKSIIAQNAGLEKTRLILQDALNNGGKVDWKTLIDDVKWNIVIPDSTATKPDNKAKKDKKR